MIAGAAGTLGGVPSEQIAQNLAFINWTILSGLAFGSFAAVVVGQFRTTATKGYLSFLAFTSAIFGGLAWLSDAALGGTATSVGTATSGLLQAVRPASPQKAW